MSAAPPLPANVADVIALHARRSPAAVAVVEGDRSWDYASFDLAIWRAAAALRAQGIAPGDRVGVRLPSTALHLVTGYALARMGALQASIPERDAGGGGRAESARRIVAQIDDDDVKASWLEPGDAPRDADLRAGGGDMPWKVVTTSGTTSAPKAVLQTHRMHLAWRAINQAAMPVTGDFRYLSVIPLEFFASFRLCMDVHWGGGTVILAGSAATPEDFIALVERTAANYLYLTPLHLQQLLPSLVEERPRLPGLRRLRTGSMTVPEDLRRVIARRLTSQLAVAYGTNEVGSPLAFAAGATLIEHPGSVGFAAPGVELRIVDDAGNTLPPGQTGHVAARMACMPDHYEDNPSASARAFREGWYYPGDLGELSPAGALYLKGRADDLMNFDGIKIYPAEIETVLLGHPAVAEAAAFPLPSDKHQDIPAAAVVARAQVTATELFTYCRDRLGPRTPRRIAVLESLPRNAAGKVLKSELARTTAPLREKPRG